MSLPSREEIDPQYRFDLTDIFETPADWEVAREDLRSRLNRLESVAEAPDDADDLRTLLETLEDCYRRKQRLDLYATLAANVNTDSSEAAARERAIRKLESRFDPIAAAVRRSLAEDGFEGIVAELEGYRRYARILRGQADRVREPAVEEAIAAHDEARSAPDRILRAIRTEDFDPPTLEGPDGESIELRVGNYRTQLSRPDRSYRREVYEAYWGEMDRFEATITRAVGEKLAAAATEADLRRYDSIRDRDLRGAYPENGLEPAIPESVHNVLVEGVRANLRPYHRTQRLRRDRLGIDRLRPWDRRVPTAEAPAPTLDYDRAASLILESLSPLGESYVDRARQFLGERRIDVFPTQDKRTDIPAYCPSSAEDGAFVLANFRGDVRTTFYLAHELGHAMNVSFHREGPTRAATSPTVICEIPSILHELLLAEECLDGGGPLAAHALDRLVECLTGNLYRNARTAAFNHEVATTVEGGDELASDTVRGTYADLLTEFDALTDYPDGGGHEWLGLVTREPYSSFQYVLGAAGALVVRDRLREGSLSPADYREFLGATGRTPPVKAFDALDVDVLSTVPYERAATTFDGYLDRFESE